jgi:glycosyltransferase involved in cell wall biosynthesis
VIVPTRDSARTLAACLESIRAQRGIALELVVVDNHSRDATYAISQRMADRLLLGGPERSAQRNLGVRSGDAEWICWIDSDMVLPPDTLAEALAVARRTGARAVAMPEVTAGRGYWTAVRALERRCYVSDVALHNPRLIRRDLFDELDGFAESMSGPEDTHVRLRLRDRGERIAYARGTLIEHDEGRLTLREIWRKRVYYGRSLPHLADGHPDAVRSQAREVLGAYRDNWRLLLRDPRHALGLVFLRAFEAVGYLAGARQGRRVRRERARP